MDYAEGQEAVAMMDYAEGAEGYEAGAVGIGDDTLLRLADRLTEDRCARARRGATGRLQTCTPSGAE